MSDLSGMTDEQLRTKKAELTGQREASKDDAVKATKLAEIKAIDKELRRRALQAGIDAGAAVDDAARQLDDVQAKQKTDAASALGRSVKRIKSQSGKKGNG